MTVAQLRKELEKFPDNMDVFVAERKTEFQFGYVNSAYQKEIALKEEPDGEPLAHENVVIIDEE